jgi:hypothetical protein
VSVYVCVLHLLYGKKGKLSSSILFGIIEEKRARTKENKIFFSDPSKSGKPPGPARNTHSHFLKFVVRRSNSFCFSLSFCHSVSLSLRFSLSLYVSLSMSLSVSLSLYVSLYVSFSLYVSLSHSFYFSFCLSV